MDHFKRLEKHQAMLQASVTSATRPLLPSLAYDESFAVNGKLILPMENRTGWASCIAPSTSQPSTFLVGFYETLKVISPQPDYLARLIRMGESGEVDPKFGNDKGYVDVNFTHEGISVIRGIHETAEGFYVWEIQSPCLVTYSPPDTTFPGSTRMASVTLALATKGCWISIRWGSRMPFS